MDRVLHQALPASCPIPRRRRRAGRGRSAKKLDQDTAKGRRIPRPPSGLRLGARHRRQLRQGYPEKEFPRRRGFNFRVCGYRRPRPGRRSLRHPTATSVPPARRHGRGTVPSLPPSRRVALWAGAFDPRNGRAAAYLQVQCLHTPEPRRENAPSHPRRSCRAGTERYAISSGMSCPPTCESCLKRPP